MARYYNNALGRMEKKHFIGLERGYHGSTSNGAGLTALPIFHDGFDLPRPWQHHIPSPYPYRHPAGPDPDAIVAACVQALRAKVAELGVNRVAAFICEPVQGSGGVIVPPRGFLSAMQATCRELDILFVIDEVITGFGRTGPMFAAEHESLTPDLMTVAKGLTAGYAPMGATLVSDQVYETIADAGADGAPFGHGFTYSGHPVSAAIGLEVLRLYQEEGLLENGRKVGAYFGERLREFYDHPLVGDVRSQGLLAGLELVVDKATKRKPAKDLKLSPRLFEIGYRNGLIFRAFADDTIGFAPPLSISTDEVDLVIDRLRRTLDAALDLKELHK
jgi:adenosylmethionine-8-amino-7-oxononanoate aminotransferase